MKYSTKWMCRSPDKVVYYLISIIAADLSFSIQNLPVTMEIVNRCFFLLKIPMQVSESFCYEY